MSRIAIVGGHGKIALRLATLLTDEGHDVTSFIRNARHRGDVADTGAAPVVADMEKLGPRAMSEVFAGHDAIVWSAGAGGGNPERTVAVDRDAAIRSMDAAEAAGVRRYVMVSYIGSSPDHGVPAESSFFRYAEAKAAADEHLRASNLAWTVLGPATLTDNPGTGAITLRGSRDTGTVSRDDVAAVVAAVLDRPETVGRTIRFTGGGAPVAEALVGVV